MARTSANASRKRDLNDGEIETILAAVDQLESVNYVKLAEKLNMTKEAAAKRWSRLKEKQFGLRKKDAGEEGVAGKSQVNFSRYIHAHHFPLFLISSLAFFAHNTTQFQLAKGHCSPHRPIYTISSLTLPSTTMASPAPALKQADVELLIAVCEQFGEVDPKKLGEKLGCTSNAAYKRWKRFKERNFGDEKANGEEGEGSEANVTTPMTPKGGKADGSAKKTSGKRARKDADGDEADGTPAKKPASTKKPRSKKPTQSAPVINPEDDGGYVNNDANMQEAIHNDEGDAEQS